MNTFLFRMLVLMLGMNVGVTRAAEENAMHDGSQQRPLRVILIPADGGTEAGTKADFEPIFKAISKSYGLHFTLRVGQSYGAVVEAMANEKVDIAFFGPVSYHKARSKGAAELLAVAVTDGKSSYYSGIFVRRDSGLMSIGDLKGKSVAFGDVNSTSSFNYPIAMLIEAGVEPVKDLGKVYLTGSHANALGALAAGKVDGACAAFDSFEKAVANKQIDPAKFKVLAKSAPIPYPPLAMHTKLDPAVKKQLRHAFNNIHTQKDIRPDMIRGYGGKKVDRYDADYSETQFSKAMEALVKVTDEMVADILKKASK